jgi:hypothetical protein
MPSSSRRSNGCPNLTMSIGIACCAVILSGCPAKVEFEPITQEVAKTLKSGTPLKDLKQVLGEPHSPSGVQSKGLSKMIEQMPEPMRTNATNDKSVAWGNDQGYVAGKMNDQEVVWVITWSASK